MDQRTFDHAAIGLEDSQRPLGDVAKQRSLAILRSLLGLGVLCPGDRGPGRGERRDE